MDVYSKNKNLQKELNSLSLAGFASGTGTSLLLTKAGKSAEGLMLKDADDLKIIIRSPFLDEIDKILLDNTPDELEILNRDKLKQIVNDNYIIDGFLKHSEYSPRYKTIIVHALTNMEGVNNRDNFIKQSIRVDNDEVAFIFQRMSVMIYDYHKNVQPVVEIIPVSNMVANYTRDQTIIAALPIDNLYWSEVTYLFCVKAFRVIGIRRSTR